MRYLAWMLPALAVAGPATAASVSVSITRPDLSQMADSSPVGPIALSATNRDGSLSASADFGRVTAASSQRLVSLRDGRGTMQSSSRGEFSDALRLMADTPERRRLNFVFDLTPTLSANVAGFGLANALSLGAFRFTVNIDASRGFALQYNFSLTDTVRAAPRFSSELLTFGNTTGLDISYNVPSRIVAGRANRFGVTFLVSNSQLITIDRFASICSSRLQSGRILETATTTCSMTATWNGAFVDDPGTGSSMRAPLDSESFADYAFPYEPPSNASPFTALTRMSLDTISAVPEPGTWATMILGFGIVGTAMRRRSRSHPVRA